MGRRATSRRFILVLCLMLLMPYTPFLSERSTPTTTAAPPDEVADSPDPERVQRVTQLLLTPTFPIHALWIAALAGLSIVAAANILLNLVFTCCSYGVEAVTSYRRTR